MRPTYMCNLSLDKVRLRIFECGCQTSRLCSTSVHSEPKGLSAGECPGFMSRFLPADKSEGEEFYSYLVLRDFN